MIYKRALIVAVIALSFFNLANAYIQKLKVRDDRRPQFFIESFGFKGSERYEGIFNMQVSNFTVKKTKGSDEHETHEKYKDDVYFYMYKTEIESPEILQDVEFSCSTHKIVRDNFNLIPVDTNWETNPTFTYTVEASQGGFYNLHFINCLKLPVSFELHLEEFNRVRGTNKIDYLPAGLSPLPTIYGVFSLSYIVMFVVWIFGYMRAAGTVLNKVHYLMAVLVALKFFSMFFYALEQHNTKVNGKPDDWVVAFYYIFVVLKTGFFFVIVTLIGTGWSFFKPFLSDKDKKIIMVVIPLQILDNIALIIVGVDDPGSSDWFAWKNIFRLVDIICCGAVLIPIIWSIKHLREASQSDGKAARNLQKLHLFRQFYLIVVSYIYFTRIIIYLLDATLAYNLLFLGDIFTELATLAFFLVVGYKFRPVSGNPYFKMEEEDAIRLEEMRNAELGEDN